MVVAEREVPEYRCAKCGHAWRPRPDRVEVRPQVCPKCKTYRWEAK